jgi:hypothetical protein
MAHRAESAELRLVVLAERIGVFMVQLHHGGDAFAII